MKTLRWMLLAGVLASAAGCPKLPPGYVKVEPPWDARFRAVSADGSALTLRSEENPENGDLKFWDKAVQNKLVEVRGYKMLERRDVTLNDKTPGVEMTFSYSLDGADYTYLVTLFVKGRRVHVFEAAGAKDRMAADVPEIRKAIQAWSL